MGLLECLAGLEPASLRYATQRDTSYTIGTISRSHGLSVVLLVESCPTLFDFHKPYALIIAHDTTEKLAKFQIKKVGRSHDQPLLCSQLLVAHDTYKTVLTRKLCGEVQELGAYAVYCALVHPVLLPCPHRRVSVVVVPHRPRFIRIAILIRTLDYLQPSFRPPQCPAVIQRDCFQLRRQPYCLLCSRITHKRMTAAATAMAARLQPRFFHSSLDAVLIAQNLSDKLVCVLSDLMLLHSLIHRPRITLCTSYHSFPNAHISCTRQVAHLSSRHCSRSKYRLPFLSTRWLYPL